MVVDVRTVPRSRTNPQFNRDAGRARRGKARPAPASARGRAAPARRPRIWAVQGGVHGRRRTEPTSRCPGFLRHPLLGPGRSKRPSCLVVVAAVCEAGRRTVPTSSAERDIASEPRMSCTPRKPRAFRPVAPAGIVVAPRRSPAIHHQPEVKPPLARPVRRAFPIRAWTIEMGRRDLPRPAQHDSLRPSRRPYIS